MCVLIYYAATKKYLCIKELNGVKEDCRAAINSGRRQRCMLIAIINCVYCLRPLFIAALQFPNSLPLWSFQNSPYSLAISLWLRYVSTSLSPRPLTVSTTTSDGLNFIFCSAAMACALSMAGIIPSMRVSS